MTSYSRGALIQQLISPSAGRFSLALLALKRWLRNAAKQWSIGLVALLVLLNLGVGSPSVENASVGNASVGNASVGNASMALSASDRSSTAPVENALLASASALLTSTHSNGDDTYFGLDAHMTNYRLTRSRLSVPMPISVKPVGLLTH